MKKLVSLFLTLSLAFCLGACGIQRVQSGMPDRPEETTEKVTDEMWIKAYRQYVETAASEDIGDEEGYDSITYKCFGLYNLNGDEVPELLVSNGTYHAARLKIISYIDGQIIESEDIGSSGMIAFVEGENRIISNYSGMGASEYHFYTLKNGQLVSGWYGYREIDITNDDAVTCYSYDEEVDEESYETLLEENMPEIFTANGDWSSVEYETQGRPMTTATEKNIALYFDALLAGKDAQYVTQGRSVSLKGKAYTGMAYWDNDEEEYDVVELNLEEPFLYCGDGIKKPCYSDFTVVDCVILDVDDTGDYSGEEMSVRGKVSYSDEFARAFLKDTNIILTDEAEEE